ncbi:MAG: menA, partial [Dehalococcoidia bacterium]|nr:menA [Dehalococcoidia bacterium]
MVAQQHSQQEVLSVLQGAEVGAVATASGESLRNRMMHFTVDESFSIYLATMKGDPKTIQMTRQPAISILVHRSETDINNSREVEVTGRAVFVTDSQERERA